MSVEIHDGNIARLEASQRILCPYCGSVAAIVAPHDPAPAEAVKGPQPGSGSSFSVVEPENPRGVPPAIVAPEPGAAAPRAPRKRRVELEVKVAAFLAANPNATAGETRAEVGGRSATIAEIYKALKSAPQSTAHAVTWAKVVDIVELSRLIADQNAVPS